MKIAYAPDGGPRQEFRIDVDHLGTLEVEMLEEIGGRSWDTLIEWLDKFERGSFKAFRAVLWVYLRRTQPDLDFDEFLPAVGEIEIDTDAPETDPGKGEPDDGPTDSTSPEPVLEASPSS